MKVLLIAPPIMDQVNDALIPIGMDAHRECPPYGMYLLAAALREQGHDVVFADLIAQGINSIADYEQDLLDCGLVGLGATSMSWPTAVSVVKQVRRLRPEVPIVAGGIHATMFDRYVLTFFPIDFVVRGEGEVALTSLARALDEGSDLQAVPNLSWKPGPGRVARNPIHPLIAREDLPAFPVPDYSALPDGIYTGLAIESSRGCAFDCSFCSTSYRQTWRGMAPEIFVDRLEAVLPHVSRTAHGSIHIIDDEFSMNTKRATEIARIIDRRGLKPELVYDSRANDLLKEDYVEAIAPFTCQFLVGAECGYPEGLELIGKGTTCERLESAARMLRKYGIADRADFSFVLGLPWETRTEVEKTISFATYLHGKYGVRILLQWYCQIPGSRLWDDAHRRGLVTEAMYDDFGFFGNLYLFRTGVQVTTEEVYEISEKVAALVTLARAMYPDRPMIEYAFPEPVAKYFPRAVLGQEDTGLASLRQVAHPQKVQPTGEVMAGVEPPPVRIGIPLRHFKGVHQQLG